MARPNKRKAIAIRKRNKAIFSMYNKGYPNAYIADYHDLTEGRVTQIIKVEKKKLKNKRKN